MLAGIENRRRLTGAMVIGNEVSRVAILMEDMDWVINPARQRLTVNAANPDCVASKAKQASGSNRRNL